MAHTLTNYNGVQIVTPSADLSADRQALNNNFKALATAITVAGPSTTVTPPFVLTGSSTFGITNPSNVQNGLATIRLPGTLHASLSNPLPLISGAASRTLAIVYRVSTTPAYMQDGSITDPFTRVCDYPTVGGQGTNASGGDFLLLARQDSQGDPTFQYTDASAIQSNNAEDNAWHVFIATYDGTSLATYLNGTQTANSPVTTTLDSSGTFGVGDVTFAFDDTVWYEAPINGDIGDVVVLSGIPSDLGAFSAALQNRWGSGSTAFDPTSYGVTCVAWFDPNQGVTTDGSGNVTGWQARIIDTSFAGDAVFSQPFQGSSYKRVVCYCNDLTGVVSYTFPTPFSQIPQVLSQSLASLVTSVSTTAVTITGSSSTGFIELSGY